MIKNKRSGEATEIVPFASACLMPEHSRFMSCPGTGEDSQPNKARGKHFDRTHMHLLRVLAGKLLI
eukprot:2180257-Alexandrium_andersonii.AAC.1